MLHISVKHRKQMPDAQVRRVSGTKQDHATFPCKGPSLLHSSRKGGKYEHYTVPSFLLSRSPIAPDKRLRLCTHKHGTCSICWGTTDDFVGSANKSSLGESLSPILASYDHRSTGGPTAL